MPSIPPPLRLLKPPPPPPTTQHPSYHALYALSSLPLPLSKKLTNSATRYCLRGLQKLGSPGYLFLESEWWNEPSIEALRKVRAWVRNYNGEEKAGVVSSFGEVKVRRMVGVSRVERGWWDTIASKEETGGGGGGGGGGVLKGFKVARTHDIAHFYALLKLGGLGGVGEAAVRDEVWKELSSKGAVGNKREGEGGEVEKEKDRVLHEAEVGRKIRLAGVYEADLRRDRSGVRRLCLDVRERQKSPMGVHEEEWT